MKQLKISTEWRVRVDTWTNVATLPGAITAAVIGGVIGTILIDGLRYLIG